MLHVLNGDAAGPLLDAAGIEGARVVWREMLSEGATPRALASTADWLEREGLVRGFEPRYATPDRAWMEASAKEDEIVLWFDRDLFCEVNLAYLAAHLPEGPRLTRVVGTHARQPDARALLARREPVPFAEAARAWQAYGADDPSALNDLPQPWVRVHLARFPSARDGLSELHRRVLRAVAEGAPADPLALHARVSAGGFDQALGLTDLMLEGALRDLERAPHALIAEGAVTREGAAVLDAREDDIRLRGIDRWLGGVHVRGRGPVWRFDGKTLSRR